MISLNVRFVKGFSEKKLHEYKSFVKLLIVQLAFADITLGII